MKRDFLEDLGIEKGVIDKIMSENGRDIESAKADIETLKKEKSDLEKTVNDRDKQLEELKKASGDAQSLKKQIDELQKTNKAEVEKLAAENKRIRINAAVERELTAAKAKNLTAVKALLKDIDKAELLEDGTVKGLSDQIKLLKGSDDSKFLFSEETAGKLTGVTPADGSDKGLGTAGGYEAKLEQARKDGNFSEVVRIKNEAYETDGIVLN